jgi:HAD superfamily hydrolase (TIGR01549 family)
MDRRSSRPYWYVALVPGPLVAICDLDGTLVDSDAALKQAFLDLGVDSSRISFGHVIAEECRRLGISLSEYIAAYDTEAVQPFAGVDEMLRQLDRWAVCSNKHVESGTAELRRLGWQPNPAMFADVFDGPKRLAPVLAALGLGPDDVVFLGDTEHDRVCARDAGVRFAIAAWNPRATAQDGDIVLRAPEELLGVLGV